MPPPRPTPRTLTGVAAAPGLAAGPAVVWFQQAAEPPRLRVARPSDEHARLEAARQAARAGTQRARRKIAAEVGEAEAAIFDVHLGFLDDAALQRQAGAAIDEGWNAEAAWVDAVEHFAARLDRLADSTLRARAADVRDVGQRVLAHLTGRTPSAEALPARPAVLVARDLWPSQVASLDRSAILAICLAEGGPTSHTAILARAWGLPAVVGLGPEVLQIPPGEVVLVDGTRGEVVIGPDEPMVSAFQRRQTAAAVQAEEARAAAREPAVTRDGHRVEVVANIGAVEEARAALRFGAEGIGLLRTEFLYLNRSSAPDEEEQVRAYRAVLETMGSRPVVVRTLDAGGDKGLPYLPLPREPNPFLGLRAIRLSLDNPELFKTQLRALLRASPGGNLKIMFPMVAAFEELRRAKGLLEEARSEVAAAGHPIADRIQVGIMVEVPSVVVLADRFAQEVAFFSIGTNDLTQYTLAADRGNERVTYLCDGCHPAVLRQVRHVIGTAHRAGIWVGVCGELAGDPDAVPLLLGLGLDEFSMAPAAIPQAKAIIRRWRLAEARELAAAVLDLDTAHAVREKVRAHGIGAS
jgi:phosphoenolpyruvate-protein phosphotransferase